MCYTGLAAAILRNNKHAKKHAKWAKKARKFFQKLSNSGSPNAEPVHACLEAISKQNIIAFQVAIQVCESEGLLQLAGLMNERCGMLLLEGEAKVDGHSTNDSWKQITIASESDPVDYLRAALWCYSDWGATAKVKQLKSRFDFLRNAVRDKSPSQISSARRQASLLGVPHDHTSG